MAGLKQRVAIVFPADASARPSTTVDQSRFAETAAAFRAADAEVVGVQYADEAVEKVRRLLLSVDAALVWVNPIEGGRSRAVLNAMLAEVASTGVLVSAHPEVIEKMGTKEVVYHTRTMSWGCDTRFYPSASAMLAGLPNGLLSGRARVLKQIRGQSGEGVWKIEPADLMNTISDRPRDIALHVRHAKRGSPRQRICLGAFLDVCEPYFHAGGGMVDQAYQSRLPEGMVRCYVVGDKVAGFGEQLVNMLVPAPRGAPESEAPLPGPRHYYPPSRPDFQRLKDQLEQLWISELCELVGLDRRQLPVLWDADFLLGAKDAAGDDTFVLCEINVSSVYPFPPDALQPLVAHTLQRTPRKIGR